nr:hypothetical protein GCM10020092_020920 [Actinoplanes digitatis]
MPTKLAAALFGTGMVSLGVAYHAVPAWQLPLLLLAGLAAILMITVGIRRHRPDSRVPWHLLAVAVALSAIGTTASRAGPAAERVLASLDEIGVGIMLAARPLLAVTLFWFVRLRTGGRRDRGGLLDALTLTSGMALLAWTFVIGPYLRHADLSADEAWVTMAFAVGDLVCLALLTRLLTTPGRGGRAALWLAGGILALLLTDVVTLVSFREDVAFLSAFGRIPLYAAAGLAAMSASMTELTRPAAAPSAELGRVRLALLALASLAAPAVLVFQARVDGGVFDLNVVAVLSACTFLLVLARMAGVMASHRQAMARERGLRGASAALVSAADADEVGDAVRTAVAQLLPADVPHKVVLAMAFTEPEQPVSPEAAAQSAHDRSTGTTARLVATREVDWAVAVRLTQFNTVLRCPLVLKDRPTGDPLVGVLHVGGPSWALRGLQRTLEVLATQIALALERIALSEEVTRRNSETYFRTLVQNTSDVILIVDDEDRVRYASPSAVQVLGAEPVGVRLPDIIHPGDRLRLADVLASVRGGAGTQQGLDFRAVGRRRTEVMLEMHCRDLRADQTVAGLVVTLRDVTERRQLERELTHQAFHDSLTGLANRVLFADRLQHALARGVRDSAVVGVLFIDLDDFKIINDTLGHAVGDQLLIAVAARIADALRADDTAARLGGDEFAALVENVQDPGAVEETATRILAALAEPIVIDGESLQAMASIGITTTPEADTADALLRQADLALYVAKGARQEPVAALPVAPARRHGAAARAALRAGPRRQRGALPAPVPAHRRPGDRRGGRLRGAGALAPPVPRCHRAGPVHRGGRGERAHRADGPLGAGPGAAHRGAVAAHPAARPAAVRERQRLGTAVPPAGLRRSGQGLARLRRGAAAGADAGDHRDPADGRRRADLGRPRRVAGPRRADRDRRLRHRLLVAELPAAAADRRPEDRQDVHRRHDRQRAAACAGRGHREPGADAESDGGGRGHRGRDAPADAGAAGLPAGPGLLLLGAARPDRGAGLAARTYATRRRLTGLSNQKVRVLRWIVLNPQTREKKVRSGGQYFG